jgi:ubiquitin carboxyl-terminal hydrolase 25/28
VEEITERDSTLKPPVTDLTLPQGKQNRRKLLRAWLEIASWLTDFKRIHGDFIHHHHFYIVNAAIATHFKDAVRETKLYVQLDSAREMYQTAIGAHPDQSQQFRSRL